MTWHVYNPVILLNTQSLLISTGNKKKLNKDQEKIITQDFLKPYDFSIVIHKPECIVTDNVFESFTVIIW